MQWDRDCWRCIVKQKPAYGLRISDWSSSVCSTDLANDGTLAAVTTRSLDGDAVTEVRKVDGSVSLHDPVTGRKLSPISAAPARSIALRAWTGPRTTIEGARLVHEPVGTAFRVPFPAWQLAYAAEPSTRLYLAASSGTIAAPPR